MADPCKHCGCGKSFHTAKKSKRRAKGECFRCNRCPGYESKKGEMKKVDYKVEEQPLPVKNDNPSIHDLVSGDIQKRKEVSIQRYGAPLQALNGRDGLVDAYEEILDFTVYLRQEIEERFYFINQVVRLFFASGFDLPQLKYDNTQQALKDMLAALNRAADIRIERDTLYREREGEVWIWQGDKYDHVESLTCPVLIQPEDLKEMIDIIAKHNETIKEVCEVADDFGWNGVTNSKVLWKFLREELTRLTQPIPMLLFCPQCGQQHIDKEETEEEFQRKVQNHYHDSALASVTSHTLERWTNPPHKSHLCHYCNVIWRPASVATVGVETIPPGANDTKLSSRWIGSTLK